jgi:hypothetical protein
MSKPLLPKPDLDQQARRLRASTADMIGLGSDFDKLSAGDRVLVDRISVLRLQVDDMRVALLAGRQIDSNEFVRASEQLEHSLRRDHRPLDENGMSPTLAGAHAKLAELIGNVANAEACEGRRKVEELRGRIVQLESENADLRVRLLAVPKPVEPAPPPPPPAAKSESANVVLIRNPSEQPWARSNFGTGGVAVLGGVKLPGYDM